MGASPKFSVSLLSNLCFESKLKFDSTHQEENTSRKEQIASDCEIEAARDEVSEDFRIISGLIQCCTLPENL